MKDILTDKSQIRPPVSIIYGGYLMFLSIAAFFIFAAIAPHNVWAFTMCGILLTAGMAIAWSMVMTQMNRMADFIDILRKPLKAQPFAEGKTDASS